MLERINLVPGIPLAIKIKRLTPVLCCCILLIGCVLVYVKANTIGTQLANVQQKISTLEAEKNHILAQQQQLGSLKNKIKNLQDKRQDLTKRVVQFGELARKKPQYSQLLTVLSQGLPTTVRCDLISLKEGKGKIRGKATQYRDLPAFVETLNATPGFSGATLLNVGLAQKNEEGLLSFTILFRVIGG